MNLTLLFFLPLIKRKNFSKPLDKLPYICYYVILRIYLLGFPWYDYIIIQDFGFVNTKIQIFVYLFICIDLGVSNCGYLPKFKQHLKGKKDYSKRIMSTN